MSGLFRDKKKGKLIFLSLSLLFPSLLNLLQQLPPSPSLPQPVQKREERAPTSDRGDDDGVPLLPPAYRRQQTPDDGEPVADGGEPPSRSPQPAALVEQRRAGSGGGAQQGVEGRVCRGEGGALPQERGGGVWRGD